VKRVGRELGAYLAAAYAQMGRTTEAQAAVAKALRLQPTFTLRVWAKFETYKFQVDLDHMLDGFRKAGLA
jgi:adenylate cyclase